MLKGFKEKLFKNTKLDNNVEGESERVVIVHNHLFKNAGSTIDWALRKNFGASFVDHREDTLMRQGATYLGPYLLENTKIKALSTHHLTMPLPELKGVRIETITMLRHPIERVTSVYSFERAQTCNSTPGVIHARKLSLKDYIIWRMDPGVGATIRNFHSRRMLPPRSAGQERFNKEEICRIEAGLMEVPMFGLVEYFDQSMVLFEDYLRTYFPKIDLSYIAQNIRQSHSEDREVRLLELREKIGDETYNLLLENNEQDMNLYRLALREFKQRTENLSGFTEKLADFQRRCMGKFRAIN